MSTSSVILCALLPAAALALPLARSAATRWSRERAGRAYGLPEDYRGARIRATASAVVLATGVVLAVVLAVALPTDGSRPGTGTAADGAPAAHAVPAHRSGPRSHRPRARRGLRPRPRFRPPRPGPPAGHPAPPFAVPPSPAVQPAGPRTIALPAGGSLQLLADGTRVWLPPQYAFANSGSRMFPLVVAYLPAVPAVPAELQPLYTAFARSVLAGKADPFVIVQPRDCSDPQAAVVEAARRYRIVAGRRAHGVMGIGTAAPCAVRAALAHPDRFGAVVGVAGTYDRAAVSLPVAVPTPQLRLMITSGAVERSQRASALRLRTALRRLGVRVRLVDGVRADRRLGGGERRRQLTLAAQYLTEQLDGPVRPRIRRNRKP